MSKTVKITDHALVRYIERVGGVDLDVIRNEIVKTVQGAVNIGAANYTCDGNTYVLDGAVVITVVDVKSPMALRINSAKLRGEQIRVQR